MLSSLLTTIAVAIANIHFMNSTWLKVIGNELIDFRVRVGSTELKRLREHLHIPIGIGFYKSLLRFYSGTPSLETEAQVQNAPTQAQRTSLSRDPFIAEIQISILGQLRKFK
jgi:hypothetical protein